MWKEMLQSKMKLPSPLSLMLPELPPGRLVLASTRQETFGRTRGCGEADEFKYKIWQDILPLTFWCVNVNKTITPVIRSGWTVMVENDKESEKDLRRIEGGYEENVMNIWTRSGRPPPETRSGRPPPRTRSARPPPTNKIRERRTRSARPPRRTKSTLPPLTN